MSIKRIMISRIQPHYTAEYIANVFWKHRIAQVKSITLFPYLQGSNVYQRAYITIDTWSDSEVAYNFIQRLKQKSKPTRIVYKDDLWWPVKINTNIAGWRRTVFPECYFNKPAAPVAPAPAAPEAPEAPEAPAAPEAITESTERVWDPSITLQSIRSTMSKFSLQDPMALMALEDIKHEIKSLEVILCQYTQNSVRAALRTYQLMALQDIKNEIQSHEDKLRLIHCRS